MCRAYFSNLRHGLQRLFALSFLTHPLLGRTSYAEAVARYDHHKRECPVVLFLWDSEECGCRHLRMICRHASFGSWGTERLPATVVLVGLARVGIRFIPLLTLRPVVRTPAQHRRA